MRRIMLTLAEDATETHCGGCVHLGSAIDDLWCGAFRSRTRGYEWEPGRRLPECIAAEAAAARMVEIAPEDVAAVRFDLWAPNGDPHECDAADRVDNALQAHAAKAEVKR